MPITIDEMTADVRPATPAAAGAAGGGARPAALAEDLRERLEAELRLLEERRDRHCAD